MLQTFFYLTDQYVVSAIECHQLLSQEILFHMCLIHNYDYAELVY